MFPSLRGTSPAEMTDRPTLDDMDINALNDHHGILVEDALGESSSSVEKESFFSEPTPNNPSAENRDQQETENLPSVNENPNSSSPPTSSSEDSDTTTDRSPDAADPVASTRMVSLISQLSVPTSPTRDVTSRNKRRLSVDPTDDSESGSEARPQTRRRIESGESSIEFPRLPIDTPSTSTNGENAGILPQTIQANVGAHVRRRCSNTLVPSRPLLAPVLPTMAETINSPVEDQPAAAIASDTSDERQENDADTKTSESSESAATGGPAPSAGATSPEGAESATNSQFPESTQGSTPDAGATSAEGTESTSSPQPSESTQNSAENAGATSAGDTAPQRQTSWLTEPNSGEELIHGDGMYTFQMEVPPVEDSGTRSRAPRKPRVKKDKPPNSKSSVPKRSRREQTAGGPVAGPSNSGTIASTSATPTASSSSSTDQVPVDVQSHAGPSQLQGSDTIEQAGVTTQYVSNVDQSAYIQGAAQQNHLPHTLLSSTPSSINHNAGHDFNGQFGSDTSNLVHPPLGPHPHIPGAPAPLNDPNNFNAPSSSNDPTYLNAPSSVAYVNPYDMDALAFVDFPFFHALGSLDAPASQVLHDDTPAQVNDTSPPQRPDYHYNDDISGYGMSNLDVDPVSDQPNDTFPNPHAQPGQFNGQVHTSNTSQAYPSGNMQQLDPRAGAWQMGVGMANGFGGGIPGTSTLPASTSNAGQAMEHQQGFAAPPPMLPQHPLPVYHPPPNYQQLYHHQQAVMHPPMPMGNYGMEPHPPMSMADYTMQPPPPPMQRANNDPGPSQSVSKIRYKCPFCEKNYSVSGSAKRHAMEKHPEQAEAYYK